MKIVAMGDTHGRTMWEEIVLKELDADKFIFQGDYFDSFDITGAEQIDNFKKIIEYKKEWMDRVILLTGNHDYHYLNGVKETYSGYQWTRALAFGELLDEAIKDGLMQICHVDGNFVFTHAGITKTWANNNDIDVDNLEESVNELFKYKPGKFGFTIGPKFSNYGDDVTQPPLWVRPASLQKDKLTDHTYVVGHTIHQNLKINDDIICIDTLPTSKEYLIIEDGVASVGKL